MPVREELYADVLLPLMRGMYSYRVGEAVCGDVREGVCVEVELGRKRYVGVVWRLYDTPPEYRNVKTVDALVPGAPEIGPLQRRLWEWMAEYYMCHPGDVMRAALPSALKPQGFSREEFARDTYRPPVVRYMSLHPSIADEVALNGVFEKLRRRAPVQYEALVRFAESAGEGGVFTVWLPVPSLGIPSNILRQLEKKEIAVSSERELPEGELPPLPDFLPELTPVQQAAMESIKERFADRDVVLLQGVTGSGKTEIYLHLIREQLDAGRNVLYLVPEIAMTAQMIERVRRWFGERIITYHSAFTDRARVGSFLRASRSRGGEVIFGVRSSVFLPQDNLGLVIVDEEHDGGYKNSDMAPRYHARDTAAVMARLAGAKVLLGSATPSLESRANAQAGKYGYVTLGERYSGVPMPEVTVSDTLRDVKRGERRTHFNKVLRDKITAALGQGEQVMLFQNRRGFSPYVECGECGHTPSCPHCNVTLTLHRSEGALKCHYCGHTERFPKPCPECGSGDVQPRGFGTEKVEQEIAQLFPHARVARLDRDTATSPGRYNAIVASVEKGETDILVGTQMITKGFDFGGVSLVGVLNADNLLTYPDFRASERAFQTLMQAGGRAGRREKRGEVVIQTSHPDHPVIRAAAGGDYEAMAAGQLAERAAFFYPPYSRLISVTLRHKDNSLLERAASALGDAMRKVFGSRVTGPQAPAVERIRDEYLTGFILKVEKEKSYARAKELLAGLIADLAADSAFKSVRVVCDVDPQ